MQISEAENEKIKKPQFNKIGKKIAEKLKNTDCLGSLNLIDSQI